MTGSIPPEQRQLLIAGYVLCDLTPEEAITFEQLLAADPAIAQEVERMQQALETTFAPKEVQPSAHLRAAILSAHQSTTQSTPQTHAAPQPGLVRSFPQRTNPWLQGLGAAAAVLIVGLSVSNVILWRSLQMARSGLQQAELLTAQLQPTQASEIAAAATIIINLESLEATLTVNNLPPLPADQVYVLWTVLEPDAPFTTDEKNAILTQVFTVNEQGTLTETITVPQVYRNPEVVTAIAVTVENADAPQRHESSPILIEQL